MVHAGFREACDSISRRLKELVLAAVDGELSEWDLLITGHSLGGALATLFTTDLAVSTLHVLYALTLLIVFSRLMSTSTTITSTWIYSISLFKIQSGSPLVLDLLLLLLLLLLLTVARLRRRPRPSDRSSIETLVKVKSYTYLINAVFTFARPRCTPSLN